MDFRYLLLVAVPFFRNIEIFWQSILRLGGLSFDYFPCAEMLSVQQNVECYFVKVINVSLPPLSVCVLCGPINCVGVAHTRWYTAAVW